MFRKTKIVCTIGPAVDSYEGILALVRAGMNIARFNCSHGDWETRTRWIKWVRQASEAEQTHIGVLVDLAGPKFRLGSFTGVIHVTRGDTIFVGDHPGQLPISQRQIVEKLTPGRTLLIGDGEVAFKVRSVNGDRIELRCSSGGAIKPRQGITLMGETFDAPALSEKDIEDLRYAAKIGAEFIALSYVRSASDIDQAGSIAEECDPTLQIIAKIETKAAVRDIANIIRESDGIMVARGDLGLQMPIEEVPLIQKKIVGMCHAAGKPVITATQMMESMIENPRPTRAEVTDVANAIMDGTDAIMLSGETAMGAYPIEVVEYMHRIAEKTENSGAFARAIASTKQTRSAEATESVAYAACKIAEDLKAKAIVSFSTSGFTARMVAKFRPSVPILCGSYRVRTARQVSLLWGVRPLLTAEFNDTEEMIARGFAAGIDLGLLRPGDLVVLTAGIPVGRPGTTNLVTLMQVTDPRLAK